jgi:outer membrane immunogenic protein
MTRFIGLSIVFAVVAGLGASARAEPPSDWAGLFVGMHAGYTEGDLDIDIPDVPIVLHEDPSGISGGALAGYNVQMDRLVLGVEADIAGLNAEDEITGAGAVDGGRMNLNGHIRGRAGVAVGNALIFAAGGLALADYEATLGFGGMVLHKDDALVGYSVGGGIEYAFGKSLVGRAEYLFDDYGDTKFEGSGSVFDRYHDLETHTGRLALVWLFR